MSDNQNDFKIGEKVFQKMLDQNKTSVLFITIGLNHFVNNDGVKREFIQHVGAYAPFYNKSDKKFFRAIAGSSLHNQMKNGLMQQMQTLGYSIKKEDKKEKVFFHDWYQCYGPEETLRQLLMFILKIKSSDKKFSQTCFFLETEKQKEYFNNFFVDNFVKYNAKLGKFICTSIDSMLSCSKSKNQVKDIKPTTLQTILNVPSKALFEPFCKVLFQNKNLQVVVKQILSIKSEAAQQNTKPKKVLKKKSKNTDEYRNFPESNKVESEGLSDDIYQLQYNIKNVKNENVQEDITINKDVTEGTTIDDEYNFLENVIENKVDIENLTKDCDNLGEEDFVKLSALLKETNNEKETSDVELSENPDELPEDSSDYLNAKSSFTMFMNPVFYEKEGKMLQSKRTSDLYLLYIEFLIHPTNLTFKSAIKHPANVMRTLKGHTYQVNPPLTKYLTKDGTAITCFAQKAAFDMITDFVKEARRQDATKQFNLFIREFDVFKKLMKIPEFSYLLGNIDNIVTLYSRSSSCLARVPDLPLSNMTSYLNNILSQDDTCMLHYEMVSNVFSGINL